MFKRSFTLIELLVVMAIIGILASVVINNSIQGQARARDAVRIQEIYQIAHALQQYYAATGHYPDNDDPGDAGCPAGWDAGSPTLNGPTDPFIRVLSDEDYITPTPQERHPVGTDPWQQCSYGYTKVTDPCPPSTTGTWAVLYAACETNGCPTGERPSDFTCDATSWPEGTSTRDAYDIAVFLKEY